MNTAQTAPPVGGFAHPATSVAAFGIAPGMIVADFGAGSGHYTLEIAKKLQHEGFVYAIDIQKDLLTRLKSEAHKHGFKNVEIVWANLEEARASKLADGHVDIVLISNLLFQLEIKEPALVEAKRILKKHGRLIVIDWSESFGGMGPIKKHIVKKADAILLTESNGFRLESEFAAGAHHYGLVFSI